jgi:hypothetical protein
MDGGRMARRAGATTGDTNGSNSDADGTTGIAEQCRYRLPCLSISDIIQVIAIRKECSRSRYTGRIIDINPATLKRNSVNQPMHSNGILHLEGVVSQKRLRNGGKGRVMTSAPSSLHISKVLPLAETLSG